MDQVIEKEISETVASLTHQHTQCQWYVQTYLIAISGLFAVVSFLGKDGKLSVQASAVGITYALVVFFMGWVFLSIVAHKAAMIHMLYKHIANMRGLRIKAHAILKEHYVLPLEKTQIRYGSLLTSLPYLFFAFNFVFVCSALTYFVAPHMQYYYQAVAVICASAIALGTFYPVVCISFNKHLDCAFKAKNMHHRYLLEGAWAKAVKERKDRYRYPRIFLLFLANAGAIGIAAYSLNVESLAHSTEITFASYLGTITYAIGRFAMEKIRIRIGIEAVRSRID